MPFRDGKKIEKKFLEFVQNLRNKLPEEKGRGGKNWKILIN